MDKILRANNTIPFPHKGDVDIGALIKIFKDQVKKLIQYLLLLLFALYVILLSCGLIASVFGANLEQQRYSSENKLDANDFILRSCQTNSVTGFNNFLNNKLMPDAAQCLGSKIVSLLK